MILDAVRIDGSALIVSTPSGDRRLAGGVALAAACVLLAAGDLIAAVAALAFLAGGLALILHRGLAVVFDTEQRMVRIGSSWWGGTFGLDAVPFSAVTAIGARQMTNGADGAAPRYLASLWLADGRTVWLLPASVTFAECDILLDTIREATGLARRDDATASPFSHVA